MRSKRAERDARVAVTREAKATQSSEEKYRRLISNIPNVVWTIDSNLNCVFISDPIEEVSGFPIDEIYAGGARLFLNCIHSDDIGRVRTAFEALFSAGASYDVECRIRRKDGRWIWVHDRALNTYVRDGMRYADGVFVDIKEKKRAEQELRQSEARLSSLIECSRDWVWEVDANGVYTYSSPKVRELLGYEPEEVIGKTPFDFMPPSEAQRVGAEFKAVGQGRRPFRNLENVNLHKDGRQVYLETSGLPIFNSDGTLVGFRGMDRDITERKRAEQAQALLASIVESSTDAISLAPQETLSS